MKHQIYTDQMETFPITSGQGNKYVLSMYSYYANAILAETLKIMSRNHLLEAYTKQVKHLTNRGYRLQVYRLKNKASTSLKKYNRNEYIVY